MGTLVVKAMVDADLVQTLGNCADFDAPELLVTRRGMTFPIQLRISKGARLGCIDSTTLVYAYNEDKKVALELVSYDIRAYGADLQVNNNNHNNHTKQVYSVCLFFKSFFKSFCALFFILV